VLSLKPGPLWGIFYLDDTHLQGGLFAAPRVLKPVLLFENET
jgi:hypothetical protein